MAGNQTSPEIAIIGGGIVGLGCAWQLARLGMKARVYEQGECGSGASGSSLGVLAPPSPLPQHPLQLAHRRSLGKMEAFAAALMESSGIDVRYERCGALEIIPNESQYHMARKETAFVEEQRDKMPELPELKLLSGEDASGLEPFGHSTEFGALYCPSAAKVFVPSFIGALKAACEAAGVEICEGQEVVQIEVDDGRVRGLRLRSGNVSCDKVLAAGGAWVAALSPILQEYSPIRPVRGQAALLEPGERLPRQILKWQKGYVVRWDDAKAAVGSTTERRSGFDCRVTAGGIGEIFNKTITAFPPLASATVVKVWAGLRPAPLDQRPIIGAVPRAEGLFAAGGLYKIGFGFLPACMEAVKEAIIDGKTSDRFAPFLPRLLERNLVGDGKNTNA